MSEWCQCQVLEILTRYTPAETNEIYDIMVMELLSVYPFVSSPTHPSIPSHPIPIHLSIYPFVHPSFHHPQPINHPSLHPSIPPSLCLTLHLSIHFRSIHPPSHPSIPFHSSSSYPIPSLCPSIHSFVYPSTIPFSLHPSIHHPFTNPPILSIFWCIYVHYICSCIHISST